MLLKRYEILNLKISKNRINHWRIWKCKFAPKKKKQVTRKDFFLMLCKKSVLSSGESWSFYRRAKSIFYQEFRLIIRLCRTGETDSRVTLLGLRLQQQILEVFVYVYVHACAEKLARAKTYSNGQQRITVDYFESIQRCSDSIPC